MYWVLSDVHGCFEEYRELLEKLRLGKDDTLFVLGDAIDRGPASISVLEDALFRPGCRYIPGNHDYFLRRLGPSYGFTAAEGRKKPSLFERALYAGWMLDGGRSAIAQFRALSASVRWKLLARLEKAPAFLETEAAGKRFVLVHKAVKDFLQRPRFADWDLIHFLQPSPNYSRSFFQDGRILVSGHKWTAQIRQDSKPLVYAEHGHVAIDCGCVFGGQLAAYCLEDGRTVYVPSRHRDRPVSV